MRMTTLSDREVLLLPFYRWKIEADRQEGLDLYRDLMWCVGDPKTLH